MRKLKTVAYMKTCLSDDLRYLVYKEPEYFSILSFQDSHLPEEVEAQKVTELLPDTKSCDVVLSGEKQVAIKSKIPKSIDVATQEKSIQKPLSGKPSEILLNGVVLIASRDIKKALINIPMSSSGKDRTLCVEEGDTFEGYKVTSIEPDLLRLDLHGEELVMSVHSGLKDFGQKDGYVEKTKQEVIAKVDNKIKAVKYAQAAEIFNDEVKEEVHEDVLDDDLRYLVYKEPEYFSMPSFQDVQLPEEVEAQKVTELLPDTKSQRHVVLSGEKQVAIKSKIPKSIDSVAEEKLMQKSLSGKPSEIFLNGIVLIAARDIKKALINIPMSSSGKDRILCVEEGDTFEGYKVTSIETDLLRLDLHGEEIVLSVNSGLNDFGQKDGYVEKTKQEEIVKVDNKIKAVKYAQADEIFNDEVEKEVHEDVLDDDLRYLVYKEPEYFSMPSFQDSQLPEEVEVQEVTALLPDAKSSVTAPSGEKQVTIKTEIPESIDAVAKEKITQNPLPGKPSEVTLNGIVIVAARGIKKALLNIPMSSPGTDRTLCVEEGDTFEGYKVTSIEPDLLRLDLHGEEMVMTIHSGLKHFTQDAYAEKSKQEDLATLDNKNNVVEDTEVEEGFDAGVEKIARADTLDDTSLSIVYEEPESLAMPVHLSEAIEIEDDDELFPFCSFPD